MHSYSVPEKYFQNPRTRIAPAPFEKKGELSTVATPAMVMEKRLSSVIMGIWTLKFPEMLTVILHLS